jgi:internalin A
MDLSRVPRKYRGRFSRYGTVADFSGARMTELPYWIGDLTDLTELNFNGNQLTRLPGSIGNLTNLTTLRLRDNRLTQLPESIVHLARLTELDLEGNQLTELPDSIGHLTNLTTLDLDGNQLTELPDSIGHLTNLTTLDLDGNQLTELPDSIGHLTNLTTLDLSDNRITQLPRTMANLLESSRDLSLFLRFNPLADPLPELVLRGTRELAAYLRSLGDAVVQYEAKVLLVGEGMVGKSSLVAALKGEQFIDGRPTTHGIEISAVSFRHPQLDVNMTLRMWDFGGQVVYRVIHQLFFSKRALYLVVWHAREGQEQDQVEGWLRRIRVRVGDEASALIVATHAAERRPDLDYPRLEQDFPGLVVGHFAIDNSNDFGIEELREAVGRNTSLLPQMGQKISPRWVAVREAVLNYGTTKPQIPYREFEDICTMHGVFGDEASTLAKLMHDLGLIIYYDEDEGLKNVVVLNPDWLTRAISYVLEDEATRNAGGILDHRRLKAVWQDKDDGFPPEYHRYFLRLMEKFDVSYRLDGEDRSLVAQLIPHRRPVLPWTFGGSLAAGFRRLTLTCELSEEAPGLISWLTVRHHRDSTGTHWRHGVFLRHAISAYQSEALLELRNRTMLNVEVRAPSPDMYLNELRAGIERLITKRWPGVHYRLLIPCSGQAASGQQCPGRFPLDALLKFRENGRVSAGCFDCGEQRDISEMLTGFIVPRQPLVTELSQMHEQLMELKTGVRRLTWETTELARHTAQAADLLRRTLGYVATEVTDCPRLFTLSRKDPGLSERLRPFQEHYLLTLWCEHPGAEHPCHAATYDVDPATKWFANIAPYAQLVINTLKLVVPVAAALDVAALQSARRDDVEARLDVMKAIVDKLPDITPDLNDREFTKSRQAPQRLTRAEGQAMRAVRHIIFEKDPSHAFGDMRRVQSPSGDLLWVCADHYYEYDPGLPVLP